jgi:hypothetical protein
VQNGKSLYHKPNWILQQAHMLGVGGGAAAVGAAALAAEATVLAPTVVPAAGILGSWFGMTTTVAVAVPTAAAAIATAALPITIGVAAFAGGTFVYYNVAWKYSTMFPDPREDISFARNGPPLSRVERGESMGVGSSLGSASQASGLSGARCWVQVLAFMLALPRPFFHQAVLLFSPLLLLLVSVVSVLLLLIRT